MNFYQSTLSTRSIAKTCHCSPEASHMHEWHTTRPLIVLYDFTPSAWRTCTIAPVPDRALLRISRSCGTYRRVRFAHYVSFVRYHERHLRMAGIINPFNAGWVSHRSYVPYVMGIRAHLSGHEIQLGPHFSGFSGIQKGWLQFRNKLIYHVKNPK